MKANICLKGLLFYIFLCTSSTLWAQLPEVIYQPGKAILTGEIKNYNPAKDLNIRVNVPDMIMISSDPVYIQPDSTGCFRQEIRLKHATQVLFRAGNDAHLILMSPDNREYHLTMEANEKAKKMPVRYTGPYADINNDFNSRFRNFEVNVYNSTKTCGMTPAEYKNMCLDTLNEVNAHNDSVPDVCPEARKLKKITNQFNCLQTLNSCKYAMVYSRMLRDSLPRMVTFGLYKDFRLPEGYFDYLKDMPLNDPEAQLCYEYSSIIPFANEYRLYYEGEGEYYNYLSDHAPLETEERNLINDFLQKVYSAEGFDRPEELMVLSTKYDSVYQHKRDEMLQEIKEIIPGLMQSDCSLILNYTDLRAARIPFFFFKPLSSEEESYFDKHLTNPLCIALLHEKNESFKPKGMKKPANYIVCDTPDGPADKALDAIIEKNKGKIQFIDMWATWCLGCRRTIKEYEPLKKDFPDVAFVYLTNETSPADLWKKLIPDISGEHYRLNMPQWNFVSKRFKLTGMPYYLIINEEGEIVDQFIYTTKKEVQRKLTELHASGTHD